MLVGVLDKMAVKKRCVVKYVTKTNPFGERLEFSKPKMIYNASLKLARLHSVKGSSLDVGPGENKAVSKSLNEMGVAAHTIDLHGDLYGADKVTLSEKKTSGKGRDFEGNVLFIHGNNSELKNKKFDWITFWASWGGFEGLSGNFTFDMTGNAMKSKKRWFDYFPNAVLSKKWKNVKETLRKDLQDVKNLGLRACKKALGPGGKIAIVSTRYVRGGGSTAFDQLEAELEEHKSLVNRFEKLGAKKVHVYSKPWSWVDTEIANLAGEFKEVIKGTKAEKEKAARHFKSYAKAEMTDVGIVNALYDNMMDKHDLTEITPLLQRAKDFHPLMALKGKEKVPIIDAVVAEF